jgi:hypothetical protein
LTDLILALANIDPPNEPAFKRVLGVPLEFVDEFPSFIRYRATLSEGPFRDVDVRIHKDEPKGLVSLTPAPGVRIPESEIDFAAFGGETAFDVNPHNNKPVGTLTRTHRVGVSDVKFQLTSDNHELYSVSVVWETR